MKELKRQKQILIGKIEADRDAIRRNIDAFKFRSTDNTIMTLSKGVGSVIAITKIIDKTLGSNKNSTIKKILKVSSFIPLGITVFNTLFNHRQK